MKKIIIGLSLALALLVPTTFAAERPLTVPIVNSEGATIGQATFIQDGKNVTIHVKAKQLTPGEHGIHIHEKGICEPPEFKTAGEHFNPTAKHHGFDNPKGFHSGDLPNLAVAEDGTVDVMLVTDNVTLKKGKANSLRGKQGASLVIHAAPDDYVTDPAGNSGARIACGVISSPQ
ncbi:superoxide dismutase [Cu-Zn] 2 [Paenibacillus montaniterrae]|uniref:Superoxide dismutase [Cu-Zn] n=1 Tax=Paenibacillus montaniterrae TaxID=429341 RepID=A0A919YMY5_9BACL|nr:superoxide dismutase family protein [Paenibacillus montaniterrae]GIP16440.1 superoxide dismutase [Cu-Zn] 2 [Paenibacillus montaniterrae]